MLLEIVDLHVNRGQRHVLKGIDLTVDRGEIIGLIGKNGSGKSTLINAVTGAVLPRSGAMTLDGEPYRPRSVEEARAAGVSVIEQDFRAPEDLTVLRNMFRNTFMADLDEQLVLGRAQEILARTQFTLDLYRTIGGLDPAEKSLAEVLRVLAEEAQLVIFDEVSSLLNDLEIAQFHEAVRHLLAQGCSVVHIAHRLEEITALSDRVVVLRDGRVVQDVPARTVSTDELARAMLARELQVSSRERTHHGEQVYAVRGLTVPGQVRSIDLTVHAGEVLGVIGMRPSGVQAVVEAVAGRVEADATAVEVDGQLLASPAEHGGRVEYVSGPDPEMLQGNMAQLLTPGQEGESEVQRLRNAAAAVTHLGVSTSYIQGAVGTLSGGDRQKVVLASVAQTAASLVVFAHPTRGIDIGAKEQAYEIIDGLAGRGKGVLLLSTDVTELLQHCDRVAVVHEGVLAGVFEVDQADEDVVMRHALTGAPRPAGPAPVPVDEVTGLHEVLAPVEEAPFPVEMPVAEIRKARRFAWF